ncbi:E3 ubiquitin-protein ligase RNF167-like [Rhineura floridana]|uniref:E3 ubiquitin-protein ligase RNF167-like n=1 Tax=Rhineura floridana TaxID=261503 RepID=UPI002AC88D9B|nr:E3 ubiquitin-protein ligase RNF167-like [Rhineura floridana]
MQLSPLSPPSLVVFSMVLEATLAKPFVYLVYTENSTCLDFKAVPACFGPPFPRTGLTGYLVEAVPANACHPIGGPPAPKTSPPGFIALIRRYGCPFGIKVFHAQQAGYQAAVIHNLYSDSLVSMAIEAEDAGRQILIPSLFIGGSASKVLRRLVGSENGTKVTAVVPLGYYNPCWDNVDISVWDPAQRYLKFWPGYCTQQMIIAFIQEFGFVILLSVGISIVFFAGFMKWYRRSQGIRVKTFKRGDRYDLCVICMAEYETGDLLKILPCTHAYHNTCINTWLLIQPRTGRTCPICKQKVNTAI